MLAQDIINTIGVLTMAAIPFVVGFESGLTNVGFTLLNVDGTQFAPRSTSGVSEIGATGRYATSTSVADTDLPKIVVWDDGQGTEASGSIELPSATAQEVVDLIEREDGQLDSVKKLGDSVRHTRTSGGTNFDITTETRE